MAKRQPLNKSQFLYDISRPAMVNNNCLPVFPVSSGTTAVCVARNKSTNRLNFPRLLRDKISNNFLFLSCESETLWMLVTCCVKQLWNFMASIRSSFVSRRSINSDSFSRMIDSLCESRGQHSPKLDWYTE
jgi:hypothetical protein